MMWQLFKDFSTAVDLYGLSIHTGLIPLLCQKLDQPSCSLHVPSAGLLLSTVIQIKREGTC